MNYINGLLFVFLIGAGGVFVGQGVRRKDPTTILLALALLALGLAEACQFILSVAFSVFALKSWYFLVKTLFWGLLGAGILFKLPISFSTSSLKYPKISERKHSERNEMKSKSASVSVLRLRKLRSVPALSLSKGCSLQLFRQKCQVARFSIKWKLALLILLGVLLGLTLLLFTQITVAVDWFEPGQSTFTQYGHLLARSRPTRWLTSLFALFGTGFSLGLAVYASYKRMASWGVYILLAAGVILLALQEQLYVRMGELFGDVVHLLGTGGLLLAVWILTRNLQTGTVKRDRISSVLGWIAIIVVLFLGANYRLNAYDDICEAMLTADSSKFISLSGEDVLSLEFFTSNRPAFITFFYKLVQVNPAMVITEYSKPEHLVPKQIYTDLNCLSGWQTAISITSWSILGLVIATKLRSSWLRVLFVSLVLAFAFVPPLADWDLVIQSESLSFSLWALTFALSVELIARIIRNKARQERLFWSDWLSFALWSISLVLWGFSRDTNIYMILLIGVTGILGLLIPAFRKHVSTKLLLAVVLVSLTVFMMQNSLLYRSDRWMNSFFNNLTRNILPYPKREAWFVERGLPTPDTLYAYTNILGSDHDHQDLDELIAWTTDHGSGLYTRYLLTHPGWALSLFWNWTEVTFLENLQTYNKPDLDETSPYAYAVGDLMHVKSRAVVWVQISMLMGLIGLVVYGRSTRQKVSLLIILSLFFIGELGLFFVSIHGDALGVIRHALVAVMPLRLNPWILAILILDNSIQDVYH